MPSGIYKHKPLTEKHKIKLKEANKGQIPWNKGKRLTGEVKKKMSIAHKGKKRKPFSEKHKRRISEALMGKKRPSFTEEWKRKIGEASKGRKQTEEHIKKVRETRRKNGWFKNPKETRKKMSNIRRGKKSSSWKGGISTKNHTIRSGIEFRLWREAVFARDNWTCQKCGQRGYKLHPHHIYNFAEYPESRFAIDNGITLCENCHRKFHRKYGYKNNTKEQLEKFLKSL